MLFRSCVCLVFYRLFAGTRVFSFYFSSLRKEQREQSACRFPRRPQKRRKRKKSKRPDARARYFCPLDREVGRESVPSFFASGSRRFTTCDRKRRKNARVQSKPREDGSRDIHVYKQNRKLDRSNRQDFALEK